MGEDVPAEVESDSPQAHVRRRQEIAAAAQAEATQADQLRAQSFLGLLDTPQIAGGMIGGGMAGPGGAAVGGAIGQIPKELALLMAGEGAPTPKAFLSRIADAGANQGLQELGGRVLISPLTGIAGRLAGRQLNKAKEATRRLYTAATKGGVRYDPLQLMDGIDGLMHEAARLGVKEVQQVADMAQNYMANKGSRLINPLEVQLLKQDSDKIAKPIFEQLFDKRLPTPPITERMFARFHKLVADNGRRMLREIEGAEALEAKTHSEIARRKLMQKVARRFVGPLAGAGAGAMAGGAMGGPLAAGVGGTAGAAASLMLTSPQMLERLGGIASHPALVSSLRQVPRIAGGLVSSQGGIQ
jgi:hypothetical protein